MDYKKSHYLYCLLYTLWNILIGFVSFALIYTSPNNKDALYIFILVSIFTLIYFLIFKSHISLFLYPYFLIFSIYLSIVLINTFLCIKANVSVSLSIFALRKELFAPILIMILLNALSLLLTKLTLFIIQKVTCKK